MTQVPFPPDCPVCVHWFSLQNKEKRNYSSNFDFSFDKCPMLSGVGEFVVCLLKENWFRKSFQIFMTNSDVLGSVLIFPFLLDFYI